MTAALLVEDLHVADAKGTPLLRGASLQARPGVPLTVLGETGSGKSLVLLAVLGALPPGLQAQGRVALAGTEMLVAPPQARRRLWGRTVSVLPQEPFLALDPTMRALSQVAETYRLVRGFPRPRAQAEAEARLRELGLEGTGTRFPFQLSGGMAQRLALAILRAADTPVLLADEPTKGLDAPRRDEAARRLRDEAERGRAVVTVTHDVAVARALGGDVLILREGAVVEHGPAAQVLASPSHAYSRALLAAEPSRWTRPARPPSPSGPPVMEAVALRKSLGGRPLLREVSLTLRPGELVAVLGSSGSGKTTLGDLLLGLMRTDGGEVRRLPGVAPWRFTKLWQDPPAAFVPHQRLRQGLDVLSRRHGIPFARFGSGMERLGLAPALLDRLPAEISGGELQRFALLRALSLDPVFLFADEPTSRLDPLTQATVAPMLREAARSKGAAVLLVTHDPDLADALADRVLRLHEGRLASAGCHPGGPLGL
ncbi:ABC transporter ATP-binding protein [Sabulicella glaciei]|uniref:ATP-binding cassette domain-containing protein n=1 Tax=Sabulicella glaciei TaxID=2984948 RepID=A0ABT3NPD0_9PROT|nr:ATP-binding cassette domain-containing protein [Roseococcus sp. MDT2-1-1]MCW8084020.1 ATP-binding cassette domain-containing protein [Roseococcus sp. MDT2-1-1]